MVNDRSAVVGTMIYIVLAKDSGNPPAVRVSTATTGPFSSTYGQKPNLLTLGGQNPDQYPSTCSFAGFR